METDQTPNKPQDPFIPLPNGKCMLLDLAREIRDTIYKHIFSPAPRLLLRTKQPKGRHRCRGTHFLQPTFMLGSWSRPHQGYIRWHKCLMGPILANEQISNEVLEFLYKNVEFRFEDPAPSLAFLNTVPRTSLCMIRKVVIEYRPLNAREPMSAPMKKMWRSIWGLLKNMDGLSLELDLEWRHEGIGPDYQDYISPPLIGRADIVALQWVKDIKEIFDSFDSFPDRKPKNTTVRIEAGGKHRKNDSLMCYWRCAKYGTPAHPTLTDDEADTIVSARWAEWYKALHKSMGQALAKLIRKEAGVDPWAEHLGKLNDYYAWRRDPYQLTGIWKDEGGNVVARKMRYYGEWVDT